MNGGSIKEEEEGQYYSWALAVLLTKVADDYSSLGLAMAGKEPRQARSQDSRSLLLCPNFSPFAHQNIAILLFQIFLSNIHMAR